MLCMYDVLCDVMRDVCVCVVVELVWITHLYIMFCVAQLVAVFTKQRNDDIDVFSVVVKCNV